MKRGFLLAEIYSLMVLCYSSASIWTLCILSEEESKIKLSPRSERSMMIAMCGVQLNDRN